MELSKQLEAILFVASKPLAVKQLAKATGVKEDEVLAALEALAHKYPKESGVVLFTAGDEWQLVTHPDLSSVVEKFVKSEAMGELTRAQLEALTVVAYRGPITRPELEQVRGVNCALILRNLMLRGLVQETGSGEELLPRYEVTMEYLRHLGLSRLEDLPDYASLHSHEYLQQALAGAGNNSSNS
jgi:segregation and condensation protein B